MSDILFSDTWTDEAKKEALALKGPIIIVGAAGFIGAKLFFSLIQLRYDVYAASRTVTSSWRLLDLPPQASTKNLINVDITHYNELLTVFQK